MPGSLSTVPPDSADYDSETGELILLSSICNFHLYFTNCARKCVVSVCVTDGRQV